MSRARRSVFRFQGSSAEKLSSAPNANSAAESNADPTSYIYTGDSTNTNPSSSENCNSIAADSREPNAADIYCEAEVDCNFVDTRDDER
jgi:hypothetical protein